MLRALHKDWSLSYGVLDGSDLIPELENTMKTIRITEDSVTEVQVSHPNGETKWLPIEAWHERWICVRWPMAGQYDIMLKDGRMIARSAASKRKTPTHLNLWHATDFQECREWVGEKLGFSREEINERFRLHHETMPGTKRAEQRSYQPNQGQTGTSGEHDG